LPLLFHPGLFHYILRINTTVDKVCVSNWITTVVRGLGKLGIEKFDRVVLLRVYFDDTLKLHHHEIAFYLIPMSLDYFWVFFLLRNRSLEYIVSSSERKKNSN